MAGEPLRYDQRPADHTLVHTAELPDTPTRDRNIVASAWVEAPPELLELGADLPDGPQAEYKRRIGRWLLWRAGPAVGDARYLAVAADDVGVQHTYRLRPETHDEHGPRRAAQGPCGLTSRTTFPVFCPVSTYRVASTTSSSG